MTPEERFCEEIRIVVRSWLHTRDDMVSRTVNASSPFFVGGRKVSPIAFIDAHQHHGARLFSAFKSADEYVTPDAVAQLVADLTFAPLRFDRQDRFGLNAEETEAFAELVSDINTRRDVFFRDIT